MGLRAEATQKQAAADAVTVDPIVTRVKIENGKSVTGAAAKAAAEYQALQADAKQKEIYANAAVESEAELAAKKVKGALVTSTEELRLKEIELKERELRIKEAELERAVPENKWLAKVYGRMAQGDGGADDSFAGTLARTDNPPDEDVPRKVRRHRRSSP